MRACRQRVSMPARMPSCARRWTASEPGSPMSTLTWHSCLALPAGSRLKSGRSSWRNTAAYTRMPIRCPACSNRAPCLQGRADAGGVNGDQVGVSSGLAVPALDEIGHVLAEGSRCAARDLPSLARRHHGAGKPSPRQGDVSRHAVWTAHDQMDAVAGRGRRDDARQVRVGLEWIAVVRKLRGIRRCHLRPALVLRRRCRPRNGLRLRSAAQPGQ